MPHFVSSMVRNYRKAVLCLVFITFAARLLVFLCGGYQHGWEHGPFGYEFANIAISLINGDGYSSPFSPPPTGPTMWHPPIVPLILSVIFRFLGVFTLPSYVTWILVNLVFCCISSLLIAFIARNAFGKTTGILSQALYAFNVFELYKFRFVPANLTDEAVVTLVVLLSIAGFMLVRNTVGRGLLGGLLLIAHPLSFILYFVFILAAYLKSTISLKTVSAILVVTVLTVTPLIIRNYAVMGGFALSKSNLFVDAYIGNVPESPGVLTPSIYLRYHPQSNLQERKLMAEIGELQYANVCKKKFLKLVAKDPSRFAGLTLKRINYFWINFVGYAKIMLPDKSTITIIAMQIYYTISLSSVLFCLYRLFLSRRSHLVGQVIVILPFIFSVPYLLTHVSLRYRTPIEPVIMIIISASIVQLKELFSLREVE